MIEMPLAAAGPVAQPLRDRHAGGVSSTLAVDCADMVIRKGFRPQIDSYSAFENDHGPRPALMGYLRETRPGDLDLSGWRMISASPGRPSTPPGWGSRHRHRGATRAIDLNGSREAARADMRGRSELA